MFVETKREGEALVETKPNVRSVRTLIAWLEMQPADKKYDYTLPDRCLLAQYLKSHGEHFYCLDSFEAAAFFGDNSYVVQARGADNRDWTFGAALERARKLAGI